MAKLGNLTIADRNSSFGSGGAFLLKKMSRTNHTAVVSTGGEVEVAAGSPYAVVRFTGSAAPTTVFSEAFENIHDGLTAIAAQGSAHLEIHKAFEECLLWWRDGSKQILRVSSIMPFGITMRATLEVRNAQGNVKPPDPTPPPLVHESLNHFRRSQATEALFESFREMYLAFESLLSWRIPKKSREHDVDWLKRALSDADHHLGLSSKRLPQWTDLPSEFYRDIYVAARCGVFHSKDARQNLYPHRIADRELVASALERLGQIVILLFREWLNVQISTGGLYPAGFDLGTKWLTESTEIIVSSGNFPLQSDETLESPAYQGAATFPGHVAVDESGPGFRIVVGSISANELMIGPVRRCALKHLDNLVLGHRLEDDLTLEGVDSFQVALGFRLANLTAPKSYFLE